MQVYNDTNNRLSKKALSALKSKGIIGSSVFFYDELSSTFDKIRELPQKDGLTVVCAKQTNGVGRLGRSWESTLGGVYFSFVIKNIPPAFEMQFITTVCALGVCRALSKYVPCHIKWPNDIVVNGKKICGILTKCYAPSDVAGALYVGVGINANNNFSSSLPYASSIKAVSGSEVNENALLLDVLNSIDDVLYSLSAEDVLNEYRQKCINIGKEVSLVYEREEIQGVCLNILKDGSMEVLSQAKKLIVNSGEVSVKGIYS